ncbi:hypothetical protein FBUS_00028 [Fasciolopsis buskii]|uniref:Uncharacterized protein n=1 Tax=Fasciolopsis buskii TaxID=27845 RepID=A0A8E0VFY3_9TREM|nr:hypothetical protein FBUS_00028 [Fasciolopsis buski]
MTVVIVQSRRVGVFVLGSALALIIAALATDGWSCGNLYTDCKYNRDMILTVFGLLVGGSACILIVFMLDLVAYCSQETIVRQSYLVTRLILLYLGTAALMIAVILYLIKFNREWSFFLAVCGAVLASHVGISTLMVSSCSNGQCTC